MDQTTSYLPWDVTHYLTPNEISSFSADLIRCANRHAHLVGDIPFQTLYTLPLRELILEVSPRLHQLSELGLCDNQDALIAAAASLKTELGETTLGDLAIQPRSGFTPAALELLLRAKKAGITLPEPPDGAALQSRRIAAKRGLLSAVPAATLKSVLAHGVYDAETRAVIQEAQNSRVLPTVIYPTYCYISFFSGRDGKDFDSLLTVTLFNPAHQVVATVSSDFSEFPDNASVGPFPMIIEGGANKDVAELKYGSLQFNLLTNGSDTWLFQFELDMGFPDGSRFWVSAPQTGVGDTYTLSDGISEFTLDLSTLNCFTS
jgi:hypothetical protein